MSTTPSSADERALPPLPGMQILRTLHADRPADAPFLVRGYTADQMRAYVLADRASLGAAQVAAVSRETVVEWLDANDIEVTDRQLNGLFSDTAAQVAEAFVHQWDDKAGAAQVPAPVVNADALHEFKVRLSEYGLAMRFGEGEKACVLADVLASMLESAGAAQVPSLSDAEYLKGFEAGKEHAALVCDQLCFALDGAGQQYRREAYAGHCAQAIRKSKALEHALSQPSQPATAAKDTA